MQKTTVKIIKLINGDDIVTVLPTGDKQLPDNGPLIRLDKPLQIKYVPQMTPMGFRDYIAMIRWTNYTSDKIVTIPKDKIMTITNASLEMSNSYGEIVKNYDNLDKPKRDENYQRKKLTPEENDKIKLQVIENRNKIDTILYQSQKMVDENNDKLSEETKSELLEKVSQAREALDSDDVDSQEMALKDLESILHKAGSELYADTEADTEADTNVDKSTNDSDEDIVDADFEEVL